MNGGSRERTFYVPFDVAEIFHFLYFDELGEMRLRMESISHS